MTEAKTDMRSAIAALSLLVLTLAGCARFDSVNTSYTGATVTPAATPAPPGAQAPAFSDSTTASFIGSEAAGLLNARERTEAASAQYYALQFGRPGAPRIWEGEVGARGEVTVGPFTTVNALDCRSFTHNVTIEERRYTNSGLACREADGQWQVAAVD